MKKFCMFLVLVLILSLTACSSGGKNATVEDAITELKDFWKEQYSDSYFEKSDGYFEIKNTRVLTIKENDIEKFKDVKYIVEFEIYTDHFATAPYYTRANIDNNVVIYEDGTMQVETNMIEMYRNNYFSTDYSDFLDSVKDYGVEYNCAENLK